MKNYIIVGRVAAGASAAARLRRNDEFAKIIMVEKGPFVSFSNCALPYRIGEEVGSDEELILMTPDKFLKQYNIEVRVNSEVIEVNEKKYKVVIKDLKDDRVYEEEYDDLVLAVGAKAIIPPSPGLENIDYFTIKTVPDVTKFMKALAVKPHVKKISVIGGGFIGVEVAENLINRGFEVALIEGSDQILAPFDYEMAIAANEILRDKGVEIKLGSFVRKFTDDRIILENGDKVETDLVILAIGVRPETEFLKDTSIELSSTGHIIDVREKLEYDSGHIKNVKNIPMSEFRSRLDEIDKAKRVYVQCQSGQRSYNVTRALLQRGYDAINVSGGYLFLSQYEKELQKINPDRKNILIK